MSDFVKSWAKDYLRGAMITLISAAIVLPLFCVFILVPLWLFNQRDASIWVLIVSSGVFLLAIFGGGLAVGVWIVSRRARWLDAAFTPLGLAGGIYLISGRQYHGTVQGREVSARFYRGPTLDLYVGTSLQTRLGIGEKSALGLAVARAFQQQPLSLADPDLSGLSVFALDEEWARSLLAHPEVKTLLWRLLSAGEDWVLRRLIYLQPGRFLLRLYRSRSLFRYGITPQQAQQWLDDLLALARAAEGPPAPRVTAEETSMEQLARSGRIATWIPIIAVALFLGLLLCGLMTALVVFLLTAGVPHRG